MQLKMFLCHFISSYFELRRCNNVSCNGFQVKISLRKNYISMLSRILLFVFIFPLVMLRNCAVQDTSSIKANETAQSRASAGVSYHEFLINEASYKFWAIFQLVTVVVLLYSTFAAIYYARYNYLMNLEAGEYDDLLFARSLSDIHLPRLDVQTFQRIVEAIFRVNGQVDRGWLD